MFAARSRARLGAPFAGLLAANLAFIYLLSTFFSPAENFPLGTALFFAFLITLLLWLYDVYKPVYDVRFSGRQVHRDRDVGQQQRAVDGGLKPVEEARADPVDRDRHGGDDAGEARRGAGVAEQAAVPACAGRTETSTRSSPLSDA